MEGNGCFGNFVQKCKPYVAMTSLQFGYAGMNIITKVSLNRGMSHYVLVVYRHAFATAAIAPFALLESVLGGVLIVMGLYSVLWGKYKEYKEKETEALSPQAIKGSTGGDKSINSKIASEIPDIESANHIQMQKREPNNLP